MEFHSPSSTTNHRRQPRHFRPSALQNFLSLIKIRPSFTTAALMEAVPATTFLAADRIYGMPSRPAWPTDCRPHRNNLVWGVTSSGHDLSRSKQKARPHGPASSNPSPRNLPPPLRAPPSLWSQSGSGRYQFLGLLLSCYRLHFGPFSARGGGALRRDPLPSRISHG